jgi:DNA (cytosine-5)-methyltransferase 1
VQLLRVTAVTGGHVRFIDLCAGLGGFHVALSSLGHTCVFAAEIDPELQRCYRTNFADYTGPLVGDLRHHIDEIPEHDILCAGFPCQPFSKSGFQEGFLDRARGTLFYYILRTIARHRPPYVILENVGNFERHDGGETWRIVRESLRDLGYHVRGTEHKRTGGCGLVTPLDIGEPHSRSRFFIVASLARFEEEPFPVPRRSTPARSLFEVLDTVASLTAEERRACALTHAQVAAIDAWNAVIKSLPTGTGVLPSYPLWSYEWGAAYPYEDITPSRLSVHELQDALRIRQTSKRRTRGQLLAMLPSYARSDSARFPKWKIAFIRKNRDWYQTYKKFIPRELHRALKQLSPSCQKLEWNVKGGKHDMWSHIIQFRPSGIRVKSASTIPSLVAMTQTQIPIIGPRRRFLSAREGLALLGLPTTFIMPASYSAAFRALGNGVHAGVVQSVASQLFRSTSTVLPYRRRMHQHATAKVDRLIDDFISA